MCTDLRTANSLVAVGDEEGRVRLMESAKDANSVSLHKSMVTMMA